jgi:hypothetical protein
MLKDLARRVRRSTKARRDWGLIEPLRQFGSAIALPPGASIKGRPCRAALGTDAARHQGRRGDERRGRAELFWLIPRQVRSGAWALGSLRAFCATSRLPNLPTSSPATPLHPDRGIHASGAGSRPASGAGQDRLASPPVRLGRRDRSGARRDREATCRISRHCCVLGDARRLAEEERRRAGVENRKAAGAVGRFHHAGRETGLTDQCRLLVAGDAADRNCAAEPLRRAVVGSAIAYLSPTLPTRGEK